MRRIYFDNAATTPLDKRVLKHIRPFLTKWYGNPSSLHKDGRIAREAIEKARRQCANALGCDKEEIFFTSGASESNVWVQKNGWNTITDMQSHPSMVLSQVENRSDLGIMTYSIPLISNETGKCMIDKYTYTDTKYKHLDITQAIGHREINLHKLNCAYASASAHKFGGLKGTGLLYVRKDLQERFNKFVTNKPIIYGHQEQGLRGGTENVVGIVSLGYAIEYATKDIESSNKKLESIISYIVDKIDKFKFRVRTSNHIINFTFNHLDAQTAVMLFDTYGVSISAGSACNSGSDEPSMSLILDGFSRNEALRTIRISIGKQNTIKEAKKFIKILREIVDKYDKI